MSKNDFLSHELTPDELGQINSSVYQELEGDVVDDQALRRLVTQRDEFIQAYLPTLAKEQRKQFAKLELPINNKLHAAVKALLTDSLSELSTLVRGRKAVQKYK